MADLNYTPPPTVKQFIRDEKTTKLIMGPVGSAKSTGCIFACTYEGLRQRPCLDGIIRTRYAIVRNTNQQLMDTTFKSFNAFFKDGEAGKWKATEKTFVLRPAPNVEIEFMFRPLDTEADIARLLSLEVSGIWFNEAREINEKVFIAAVGRIGRYPSKLMLPDTLDQDGNILREGGCDRPVVFLDTNPPEEDSWLYKLIEENTPENMSVFIQPPALIPGTYDVNPDAENLENLPKDYYETQVKSAVNNEEYINVYLRNMYGRTNAGKPVFPMFNPGLHIARGPLMPNPLLPLAIGFDPGLNSGLTFGQYTLNGQLLAYDCLSTQDMGTERLIDLKIKPLLAQKYKGYEVFFTPDPAANNRSSNDEKTAVDWLRKAGFKVKFVDMNNTLQPRLEAVEHFLTRLTDNGPAVLLDPVGCKPLIKALSGGYRYAKTKAPDQDRAEPEKNIWSHPADSFQYLCRYFQHTAARSARYNTQKRFVPPTFQNTYAMR
jgi:hypothetical protein